jgi:hypothetical protein
VPIMLLVSMNTTYNYSMSDVGDGVPLDSVGPLLDLIQPCYLSSLISTKYAKLLPQLCAFTMCANNPHKFPDFTSFIQLHKWPDIH